MRQLEARIAEEKREAAKVELVEVEAEILVEQFSFPQLLVSLFSEFFRNLKKKTILSPF